MAMDGEAAEAAVPGCPVAPKPLAGPQTRPSHKGGGVFVRNTCVRKDGKDKHSTVAHPAGGKKTRAKGGSGSPWGAAGVKGKGEDPRHAACRGISILQQLRRKVPNGQPNRRKKQYSGLHRKERDFFFQKKKLRVRDGSNPAGAEVRCSLQGARGRKGFRD